MRSLRSSARVAFGGIVLGVSLLAMDVYAAEKSSCLVERIDTDGNRIAVWCQSDSNIYYMFKTGYDANCGGTSVDTMKMWLSQFQAALLSGKPAQFFYNPTTSNCAVRLITSVGLRAQ